MLKNRPPARITEMTPKRIFFVSNLPFINGRAKLMAIGSTAAKYIASSSCDPNGENVVTRVNGRLKIYILLTASKLITAVNVAPVTKLLSKKNIVWLFLMVFTIAKYPRALITIGVTVARELYLSGEKRADTTIAKVKIITGISRGVLRICTFFSMTAMTPMSINVTNVTRVMSICFGRRNASVVTVRKKRGKLKKNIPHKNKDRFSK